jgi:hypothetical protein
MQERIPLPWTWVIQNIQRIRAFTVASLIPPGGFPMNSLITEDILLSSLHCSLKGYLKFSGEKGTLSDYELFIDTVQREVLSQVFT